jgi:hypothetical protein
MPQSVWSGLRLHSYLICEDALLIATIRSKLQSHASVAPAPRCALDFAEEERAGIIFLAREIRNPRDQLAMFGDVLVTCEIEQSVRSNLRRRSVSQTFAKYAEPASPDRGFLHMKDCNATARRFTAACRPWALSVITRPPPALFSPEGQRLQRMQIA